MEQTNKHHVPGPSNQLNYRSSSPRRLAPLKFSTAIFGQDAGSDGSAWCGPDASRSWRVSFDCTCGCESLESSETVEDLYGFYMVFYLVFIWFLSGLYMVYIWFIYI
jgi:hypothetical protein